MSELNALAQKLAVLSARDVVDQTGARMISEGGLPSPLAAILREVDDTVLERCLAFRCGDTTVRIIAAGRRMRGILSVSPKSDADVIGQVLSREDPDVVQAAHDLLQTLCGNAENMTVRSLPSEPFGNSGERGISALGLAELWDVALAEADSTPKPPMEQFLTVNAPAFSSVLHIYNGEIVTKEGDFAALQAIWSTQVEAFREAHRKTLRGEEAAQLICLDGAFDNGNSAALALYENHVALIAYEAERFGAMQASWQRIFA
ncbi:hypothetical protein AN191_12135 [Loktanella sp. 5RATIMAR09]|uniref:hypothetical protein n=1 Tax=Loktanella sp. 5RATIMAR09 TaxID=1225655 RepID=UPI0006EBC91B|nr:hypothetical protein [Loktanella sp. 5RATIMAR09]KQI71723.1 hypothetical protein AN191_12135 [Loktanella sp. 5RATIMAR09]